MQLIFHTQSEQINAENFNASSMVGLKASSLPEHINQGVAFLSPFLSLVEHKHKR